ncbi:MAG: cell division protein FtsW [Arsenophonus sp.]|nr:MAG: cell division protein FtsW [Arsenophonus sp.]
MVGFIMVTSASISIGQKLTEDPYFFAKKNLIYLIISSLLFIFILTIPIKWWEKNSITLLIFNCSLLIIVLFFGENINGSSRWIHIGIISLQPSEITKLTSFIYISGYIVRKYEEVKNQFFGFIKPIFILIVISILLLIQPDFGTIIILLVTILSLLFLAGAKLIIFVISITSFVFTIFILITIQPYRLERIMSFLNPWEDPFNTGYQLTQSLMAFGRGFLFGEGLGNSIQKLEYLPEAHTDFIFSILAEELGYFGVITVLLLLFYIIFKSIKIGKKSLDNKEYFSGYLACAIGIWLTVQALINIGSASGLLPTKGLTLPLISYGGSSLLIIIMSIAILIRIDFEIRTNLNQAILIKNNE